MSDKIIYELHRFVCVDEKHRYPFEVFIESRYIFNSLEDAEQMVKKLSSDGIKNVYCYCIYTYPINTKLGVNEGSGALKRTTYLADGTMWMASDMPQLPIQEGDICEYLSGNIVDVCMIENVCKEEGFINYLTNACNPICLIGLPSDFYPLSLPVNSKCIQKLKNKNEIYKEVQHGMLSPIMGVPYDAINLTEDNLNDYLYIPSSFSGFRYDIFLDVNTSYITNMHPLWLYIAYPIKDKTFLIPVSVGISPTSILKDYEELVDEMIISYNLAEFVIDNLRSIIELADKGIYPEAFFWNMKRLEDVLNARKESDFPPLK